MSKLTTALEGEKEKFDQLFGVKGKRAENLDWNKAAEAVKEFSTASNLRILAVVEKWARENKKTWEHPLDKNIPLYDASNQVFSDLISFLQEAITNTK